MITCVQICFFADISTKLEVLATGGKSSQSRISAANVHPDTLVSHFVLPIQSSASKSAAAKTQSHPEASECSSKPETLHTSIRTSLRIPFKAMKSFLSSVFHLEQVEDTETSLMPFRTQNDEHIKDETSTNRPTNLNVMPPSFSPYTFRSAKSD